MKEVAPDGTELHVQRNHGKPTRAQELARALEEARKAKKGNGKAAPDRTTETTERTEPAPKGKAPMPSVDAVPSVAEAAANPVHAAREAKVPNPVRAARKAGIQVRFTGMKPMHVVEAALFAAGKPITVEEMAEQTGLPPDSVRKGVVELQAAYQERDTILEVGKAGAKWAMQVRSLAAEPAAKFAPMEIAPKLLKTLALIAFHQPMKQSQLVEMMGSKVYDHIPELVQRGLVRAREEGPTKILVTTPAFPEYFGLDAANPDEVRRVRGKLVGIEAAPREKPGAMEYVETQVNAAQSDAAPSAASPSEGAAKGDA
ncbi:MAG TPA: SMC-Scp complex subunit ScpB [Candidatus Thermoplasmatota archaeon]|nr:SMC-Scp complex subunit ScpB [Candidatus Thermoplasmatota archaeon]